ncbi:MAG TPA: AraC family transcriptional regulator, partial [Candidatus Brevibacterium intestinigallinarum]|nr:AraC family transcriptional regulator [Candidatus Brevibacterium intestinigallinarum]
MRLPAAGATSGASTPARSSAPTADTANTRADALLMSALALAQNRPDELSVADLADHVGYSPFHFSRLFTHRLGIGP